MKDVTSKIVHSLNEAIDTVEAERTVGIDAPKQVHQCDNCADFYLVSEVTNESICPHCGGEGHPYGSIVTEDEDPAENDADPAKISNPRLDEDDEEDEEELKSEAEVMIDEALKLLDRNDYKRFNEGYRPRSRVNTKGELEILVESNGHFVTAHRRMTSRQKTAYSLSERFESNTAKTTAASKKNEAIKARRQELLIKNESRAVKIQACRLLERMGVKYDFAKFNEGMNKFLANRKLTESIEKIAEDDEIGTDELDQMTPDQIGDQVVDVIEDTGLETISNDVEIDGETATVNIRVQDSDEVEVHASEIQDVLQDVFDAPVEIVGPYETEGDKTVQDLAVIVNPDSDLNEDNKIDEPEVPTIAEGCDENDKNDAAKSESVRRRRSRRKNESFVEGTGNSPLFALVSNMTVGNKNNAPEFLAHDDSLITGDQPDAEEKARTFISYEAAQKYLQDAGLEDQYTPVSITVVTNNANESIDDGTIVDEDDEIDVKDDEKEEIFETEDGKYFKEDGSCFKESIDGTIQEVDESEFEDAKETAQEIDKIQESFRKRNARRARRRK